MESKTLKQQIQNSLLIYYEKYKILKKSADSRLFFNNRPITDY